MKTVAQACKACGQLPLKFGKLAPKVRYDTPRFKDYVVKLPSPPQSVESLGQFATQLHLSGDTVLSRISKLFPIDGNDANGDCTIAGLAHLITLLAGCTGKYNIMPSKNVVKLYYKLTGGPDSGLACLDVLDYFTKTPVSNDQCLGYVKIDPKNHTHVQQGINLFKSVYLGFQCQANVLTDFNAGKPWTPGTLTNDGHCVVAESYDQQYVGVFTWGATQLGTWAWWDETVDECYAIVTRDAKSAVFDPGFNFAQLEADLASVGN